LGEVLEERRPPPPDPADERREAVQRTREGVVVGDKMAKTRVVLIERVYRHPRYERVVRRTKRLKAHDERNASKVGDRVLLEETRPLSKEKRWRIRDILTRAS
jgi:small subunit ribosomal protein S17